MIDSLTNDSVFTSGFELITAIFACVDEKTFFLGVPNLICCLVKYSPEFVKMRINVSAFAFLKMLLGEHHPEKNE